MPSVTAADSSVAYAVELAQRNVRFPFGAAELAYLARTSGRDAYKRTMDTCQATKAWAARACLAILDCSSTLTARMYQLPALMMSKRMSTVLATTSEPPHRASRP